MPIAVRQAFLTAIDKRGHTNLRIQPVLGALKVENISSSNSERGLNSLVSLRK